MRKVKTDKNIRGYIPVIIALLIFFFVLIIFGPPLAFKVLGGVMIVFAFLFGFWSFQKTNNYNFLVSAFYLISFGLLLILADLPSGLNGPRPQFTVEIKFVFLFFLIFLFWLIYLGLQKKMKYRGNEVMELAARDVEIAFDTYTERPRPAGEIEYQKYDLIDFGNHLKKNLICMSFLEENRLLLVPIKISDYLDLLFIPDFDHKNKTWISFGFDGKVSVHISRKDYLNYNEDLSFDQLCESLGQLFVTFADYYMRGDKARIIDRLNSVKLGLFV